MIWNKKVELIMIDDVVLGPQARLSSPKSRKIEVLTHKSVALLTTYFSCLN